MQIHIREAALEDIGSMIELLDRLFSIETDFKADILKQRRGLELLIQQGKSSCTLVAESDGKVVGMLTAQTFISTAEGGKAAVLEDMIVNQNYRNKGIGKMLMQKMEQWAMSHNIRRLQLLADKNNLPALDYYKKLNWNGTQLICLRKYLFNT